MTEHMRHEATRASLHSNETRQPELVKLRLRAFLEQCVTTYSAVITCHLACALAFLYRQCSEREISADYYGTKVRY